jgi:hypothetical protein
MDGFASYRAIPHRVDLFVHILGIDFASTVGHAWEMLCESSPLLKTERGFIVEIVFSGSYGEGSQGNPEAREMAAYVMAVVKNDRPAAILFNLTNLQYEFGDGGIALPLMLNEKSVIPACFVANGTTAQALQWFFQRDVIFGIAGFKLFPDREQGLAFLKERTGAT